MTAEKMKKISNLIFWLTTAFAVVTLVIVGKDYIAMAGQGVCPISRHNGLIYTALGLLLGSVVVTSFLDGKVKKMANLPKEEASIYDRTLENLKKEDLKADISEKNREESPETVDMAQASDEKTEE